MMAAAVARPPGSGAKRWASQETTWYATSMGPARKDDMARTLQRVDRIRMTAGGGRETARKRGISGRYEPGDEIRRPPGPPLALGAGRGPVRLDRVRAGAGRHGTSPAARWPGR